MRALYAQVARKVEQPTDSTTEGGVNEAVAAGSTARKRPRDEPSISASASSVRGAAASLSCVARCVSCAPGCACGRSRTRQTTRMSAGALAAMAATTTCAPKRSLRRLQHLGEGTPIAVSTVPTAHIGTAEARHLCEAMMTGMRKSCIAAKSHVAARSGRGRHTS
jgi:hypothetical protein